MKLGLQFTVELIVDGYDPATTTLDTSKLTRIIKQAVSRARLTGQLGKAVTPVAHVDVGIVQYQTDYPLP